MRQTCHNLHNYTHAHFTCCHTILHTTTFLLQTGSIRKYILSSRITFTIGQIKNKPIRTYIPSYYSCIHVGRTIFPSNESIFLLLICGHGNSIEYFIVQSSIPKLTRNCYISLRATDQFDYFFIVTHVTAYTRNLPQ